MDSDQQGGGFVLTPRGDGGNIKRAVDGTFLPDHPESVCIVMLEVMGRLEISEAGREVRLREWFVGHAFISVASAFKRFTKFSLDHRQVTS